MPELSIVIPVYNIETWLPACLDSCIDLTRKDSYEIIAVNDGSTDGSARILEEYAGRFPDLIRVLSTPNGGLGHARNAGLSLARGEHLVFLDSDDTLSPGAVGEMLDSLDGSFQIGFFDFTAVNEQGRELSRTAGCPEREGLFSLEDCPELIFSPPNAVNKLWKRSLFLDSGVRFPDRLWFEDLATVPKLYLHAEKMRRLPRPWYRYLRREGSITLSSHAERNLEMIDALDSTLSYYRELGAFERYEKELCYLAVFHELLTSQTRVNLIDPRSPVQDALLEDFLRRFPDYEKNPYVRSMPAKHKLLVGLIAARRRGAVHLLMRGNELLRRKDR